MEQAAQEVAVLLRVLWCEFTWLIGLVALGVILGLSFCGCFSGFAGRRTRARVLGGGNGLDFREPGFVLAKGPVGFTNASLGPFLTRPTTL